MIITEIHPKCTVAQIGAARRVAAVPAITLEEAQAHLRAYLPDLYIYRGGSHISILPFYGSPDRLLMLIDEAVFVPRGQSFRRWPNRHPLQPIEARTRISRDLLRSVFGL